MTPTPNDGLSDAMRHLIEQVVTSRLDSLASRYDICGNRFARTDFERELTTIGKVAAKAVYDECGGRKKCGWSKDPFGRWFPSVTEGHVEACKRGMEFQPKVCPSCGKRIAVA